MDFGQTVSKEVTVGVIVGAFCLTAILYLLYLTEDRAVALMFSDEIVAGYGITIESS
jgi:hypothetical protein